MFSNYIKVAWRNIIRNKSFSVINISGLAIGMASAILILLWVQNEMSYDASFENSDRIYQLWNRDKGNNGISCWNNTTKIAGPELKKQYPEVEQSTRVNWDAVYLFSAGDKNMNASGTMVDPDFLTMFRFPFLSGDMNTALNEPGNIVITEGLAKKLFGNANAMGKTMQVDNKYNFVVTGVMKDLPNNTNFNFQYLLPWSFMKTINQDDSSWGRNSTHNFVMLKPNTDIVAFNKKIVNFVKDHGEKDWTVQNFLYLFSKVRLYSNFENGVPVGGKIETVRQFTLIAVFILLIACINFMNMSTARSEKRAKEVGIRKVAGAQRKTLIAQFLGESILIAMLAGFVSLLLVQLVLPAFNKLTYKHIFLDFSNIKFWLMYGGFVLFSGIVAGSYPAFFLSSFRPVSVLKGSFKKASALVTPRKILVVLQFSFAITLIVVTLIIERQVKYAEKRKMGYDKENLLYTFMAGDVEKNYELIRHDLLNKGIALSVTKSSAPLTESWSTGGVEWDGKDPSDKTDVNYFNSDGALVKTAGLQLIAGRDIDLAAFPTDSTAVLVNESAARVMHMKDPVGKVINKINNSPGWHIVGLVKDFILQSPYDPVKPLIIQGPAANWFNLIHIRLNNAHSTAANIAALTSIFKQYNPRYPFDYVFVDEKYAQKFSDERTTATLAAFFAGLTIFISCLGLFGLAAYMAENRIKEIGVRKVLGASVTSITVLLSKDFLKLVLISICIASPYSWWAMHNWLEKYDYHISISPWIFVLSGAAAILIAMLTVSFQSVKAAMANPVKSLRAE